MEEGDRSGVERGHGREKNFMATKHVNLVCWQKVLIFCADKADADLVTNVLQDPVGGLVERSQYFEAVTRVHDSDILVIMQHYCPFFGTIQKVEGVEPLDKRMNSGDRDEVTAL